MVDPGLREINHGDFESLTMQELKEKHAEFITQWMADPSSVIMPNGESLQQLQYRAWSVIKQVLDTSKDTLVVSHGMTIMTILCKIQNLSLSQGKTVFVDIASKTVVDLEDGDGIIEIFNDTAHLDHKT